MLPRISLTSSTRQIDHLALVAGALNELPEGLFTAEEISFIRRSKEELKQELVVIDRLGFLVFLFFVKREDQKPKQLEAIRRAGDRICESLNRRKAVKVFLWDEMGLADEVLALAEGMILANYQFRKYLSSGEGVNTLKEIGIYSTVVTREDIRLLQILTEAVFQCRDLINEPVSTLTATRFAREMQSMGEAAGVQVEVMSKKKIEALKMGGLLGVNQASKEPPTFTVMEYKAAGAHNTKPIVLVGKGIVYDTGGMNLKPGGSLMNMKDDMSGGAAVASVITAIAKARLPVHVVGLVPATDNRIGPGAIVPGDILHMHNGTTVEVIDTDAEGRLILADALSYAKRFDPMLVIDMATLTGSAIRAIGNFAAAAMQINAGDTLDTLRQSGDITGERFWEFPMWEEYEDFLKSEIADLKNLGPPEAGAITAAKFLGKFTAYPWIHLDIAGPAFADKRDSYRGQGGTGFGVRLLFNFVQKI